MDRQGTDVHLPGLYDQILLRRVARQDARGAAGPRCREAEPEGAGVGLQLAVRPTGSVSRRAGEDAGAAACRREYSASAATRSLEAGGSEAARLLYDRFG